MNNLSDDGSLPQTVEELEAEITIIEQMITENMQKLKELMQSESFKDGIFFAKEIHDQRQTKLILQTRKYLRTVHVRRIRYMESLEQ